MLDYALRWALETDASLADINNGHLWLFLRERKCPRSSALYITDLADGIGRYGMTNEATERMHDAVIRETKMVSLRINLAKTKNMVRRDLVAIPGTVTADGASINERCILGSLLGALAS